MSQDQAILEFLSDPPEDFAVLGLPTGDLKIFLGPFKECNGPTAGQVFVYCNDFFLKNPSPFLQCEKVINLNLAQRSFVAGQQLDQRPAIIDWDNRPQTQFLESFAFFRALLNKHEILKAVPIGFAHGKLQKEKLSTYELRFLLSKITIGQPGLYSYALSYKGTLLIGASPEILCVVDQQNKIIRTEAVAGSIIKTHAPLSDITGKLKEEHELVVKDLEAQLVTFGRVRKSEISLKNLSSLSHLQTELEVMFSDEAKVEDIILKLHPSGALGVLPRVNLKHEFIKKLDLSQKRSCFGAPFGAIFEDGGAVILVAIRNLIISGRDVLLGAGAGITYQSEPNSEMEEVLAKQKSVKSFFGL